MKHNISIFAQKAVFVVCGALFLLHGSWLQGLYGFPKPTERIHPKVFQASLQRIAPSVDAPQSLITSILRDKRGFMWFATETGLVRYDARNFMLFRPFPDKPSFDNAITTLHCDTSGCLWIGTNAGLYSLERLTNRIIPCLSIPNNISIRSVGSDAQGNIFVGAGDTLYIMNGTSKLVIQRLRMPAPISVISLNNTFSTHRTPSAALSLLVGTEKGLMRLVASGNSWSIVDTLLQHTSISAILVQPNGTILCGTANNGLYAVMNTSSNKQIRHFTTGLQRILSLSEDAEGKIWCSTAGDGVWVLPSTLNTLELCNDAILRGRFVTSMYHDVEGILWLGTSDGSIFKGERTTRAFRFVSPPNYIISGVQHLLTMCVYEDSEGIVWLGTERGLLSYNPQNANWSVFQHRAKDKRTISGDLISCVYEDRNKNIWVGTTGSGLNRFDRKSRTFTAFTHKSSDSTSLSSNNISCIYEDSRGRLWIGTWIQGINLFDPTTRTFTHYRSNPDKISTLSSNSISCIIEDRMIADGTLWIGTYEDGLNAFHPTIQAFTRHFHNPQNTRSLNSNAVSAIYELADGTLWVTTDAGLNKFNRQTQIFTRYGKANGLPDEPLSTVVGDKQGYIWLTAGASLCRFNPRSAETRIFDADDGITLADGLSPYNKSLTDLSSDNIIENLPVQFSSRAYHSAPSGKLYFGIGTGFLSFHPDSIVVNENKFVPPVVITALKKFNNPIDLPQSITEAHEIELWYTDNFISFEFAALAYSFSHKNRFQYKLDGFDKYWIDAGTKNEAVYTNLDGGEYTFRVRACNSNGVWNEQGCALRVIVHPPMWKTTWFYALCAVMATGGVLGALRWRERIFRKRNAELKRLVDERTSQLQHSFRDLALEKQRTEERSNEVQRLNEVLNEHNTELARQTRTAQLEMLRYQLNPHFLFNALISISDLIKEDPALATRTMTTLMAYLRYALQPAGLPTTPLAEEVKALSSYLTIEKVRFEERLQVEFEIAKEAESVKVPSFILQPLVENAIKYGMRTSPMPLRIWVLAEYRERELLLEVVNSGTLHLPDGVVKPEGTGIGLTNIRERLQVLFPNNHEFSLFEENGRVHARIVLRG